MHSISSKVILVWSFLLLSARAQQVLTTPCADVFEYESISSNNEQWNGVLHLRTNVMLHGVFIDVILDSRAHSLGANYRFSITTLDNTEYRLDDRTYKLRPSEQTDVRFYVRYNSYHAPKVISVRLNGQRICPDHVTTTEPIQTVRSVQKSSADIARDTALYYEVVGSTNQNSGSRTSNKDQPVTSRGIFQSDAIFSSDSNYAPNQLSTIRSTNSHTSSSTPYYTPTSLTSNDQPLRRDARPVIANSGRDDINYESGRSVTTRPVTNQESTTRRILFNHHNDEYPYNQVITTTTESYRTTRYRDDRLRAANARTTTRSPYFQGDLSKFNPTERDSAPRLSFDTCGEVARKSNALIVSGEESYRGQFPWHAALYISSGPELKYTCGGSLINRRTILTAAHCVALKDSTRPMQASQLLIYLGKYSLLQWNGPEEDVKVSEIIIHPNYENEKFYSDLAIVKLKTEARFSEYVRPVCLWPFNKELRSIVNKIGTVPGFGYNEHGIVDDKLSHVNMPVVTHETCIWSNRDFFSRLTSNVTYCAGFNNGSSVCNGDSGGGMVFKENNKWYIRGIVSVSIALQNHFLCDPDHYAIFTDVAQFTDWIRDHM
ncbi:serine proteinase stubble-like isoform X2 [Phlebotomus argentipes]|uniref:serine proteinase stubble-like isoform X2 n=1 Tax=Phlebotomus argentipes TaxID=94469 RepID=UPI0028937972|nr:serine proteinase stubble-like isoform X2 [Phlebotomus argentipes]